MDKLVLRIKIRFGLDSNFILSFYYFILFIYYYYRNRNTYKGEGKRF